MPTPRWNFSLKQFLLACGLVSVGMGMIAVASLRAIGELAVPGAVLLGLGVGILVGRPRLVCVLFAVTAIASWATMEIRWIGGTNPYQLELTVVDTQGKPIEGATLTPLLHGEPMTDRFFSNHSETPPSTDRHGELSCLVKPHRFGGKTWFLFWCIPIPERPPHFIYRVVVEVDHPNYKPVRLSAIRLVDEAESLEEPFDTVEFEYHGDMWEVPVYPTRVEMEPK